MLFLWLNVRPFPFLAIYYFSDNSNGVLSHRYLNRHALGATLRFEAQAPELRPFCPVSPSPAAVSTVSCFRLGRCIFTMELFERKEIQGNGPTWKKDHFGRTQAHVAAWGKRLDRLKKFHDQGLVKIDEKDAAGRTVSHWAAMPIRFSAKHERFSKSGTPRNDRKSLSVLAWLHRKGLLDADLEDAEGLNITHIAARFSHFVTLDWLHSVGLLRTESSRWNMAMHASAKGNLKLLQWLHEKGLLDSLKIDTTSSKRRHLGHNAASFGQLNVLKWLHSEGILDLKIPDKNNRNIAYEAARHRHLDILYWLESCGLLRKLIPDIWWNTLAHSSEVRALERSALKRKESPKPRYEDDTPSNLVHSNTNFD